jgi:hypothetical protein
MLDQAKAWVKAQYWSRRDHRASSTGTADASLPVILNTSGRINSSLTNGQFTGDGTVATGGFTLTVPATGTAALLGAANVFTAAQTLNGVQIGGASEPALYQHTGGFVRLAPTVMSFVNDDTYSILAGTEGLFIFNDITNHKTGLFVLHGGGNSVASIFTDSAWFTTTAGNAGTLNIYYSGGYLIQNKTGGTINISIVEIGR